MSTSIISKACRNSLSTTFGQPLLDCQRKKKKENIFF